MGVKKVDKRTMEELTVEVGRKESFMKKGGKETDIVMGDCIKRDIERVGEA